ncbi:hypothetical protein Bhyg_16895, partial [Pseudolycoriella hygida]
IIKKKMSLVTKIAVILLVISANYVGEGQAWLTPSGCKFIDYKLQLLSRNINALFNVIDRKPLKNILDIFQKAMESNRLLRSDDERSLQRLSENSKDVNKDIKLLMEQLKKSYNDFMLIFWKIVHDLESTTTSTINLDLQFK